MRRGSDGAEAFGRLPATQPTSITNMPAKRMFNSGEGVRIGAFGWPLIAVVFGHATRYACDGRYD